MYRNKLARLSSQSHGLDSDAKRPRLSRDDDNEIIDLEVNDQPHDFDIDISDLVCRDEGPMHHMGKCGSKCIQPANDFEHSLAQWVNYRNTWVLIPDWYFRTDAQHIPECECRFCEILKLVKKEDP